MTAQAVQGKRAQDGPAGDGRAQPDAERSARAEPAPGPEAAPRGATSARLERAPRAEAFRAAERHSRRVLLMKRGIVAVAVFAALLLAAAKFLDPFAAAPAALTLDSIGVSGTSVTMAAPKLSGYRSDNRPYQLTAREAVQDVTRPQLVELRDLDARIAMGAQGAGRVTAKSGLYDSGKETMELAEDIRLRTDEGHELALSRASIDFKAGSLVSHEPVAAQLRASTINADSFKVADGGRVLVFEGRVRTQIRPEAQAAPGSSQARKAQGVAP
jgi:lipopolysaccharide export system protein LptC